VGELRWTNEPDVRSYLAWAGQPTAASSSPERQWEELDEVVRARERLMLAARTGAAVELAAVAPALDSAALEPLAEAGFILLSGGKLRVARKGRYVANEVCVRLFRDFAF
jgi:coproporphyrinogen III oxidase-like Fe-S oxidoreductase